jgi:hypothetical protein
MLNQPLFYFRLCSFLLFLFLSVLVMGSFIAKSAVVSGNPTYSIFKAADGIVKRPFVGRILLPQLSNVIAYHTPDVLQKIVSDVAREIPDIRIVRRTFGTYNKYTPQAEEDIMEDSADEQATPEEQKPGKLLVWSDYNIFRTVVALVMFYICMLVYGASLYSATQHFFPGRPWLACLVPIYGLLLYHCFSNHKAHIYDMPQIMLFSLMLLAMHKEKWLSYFVLFLFACLNKETAFLMIGVFFLYKYKDHRMSSFWRLLLLQAAIWVACYMAIHHFWFDTNRVWRYFLAVNVVGLELASFSANMLLKFILAWFLLMGCWDKMPELLKKAVWLLPALIVLYLIFGYFREYRVLFEALPVCTLITGYTLFSRLDTRLSARQT